MTQISIATVSRYLHYLQEEGHIELDGHRGIIAPKGRVARQDCSSIPVVGKIACGPARLAEQNVEEYFRLPVSMTRKGELSHML